MAITVNIYDHTLKLLLNKEVTFTTLKIMLLTAAGTFTRTHTTVDAVAGAVSGGHRPREVYGNGWTEGGELIANVAVTQVTLGGDSIPNDAMLDGDDVIKTAAGGSIGPAYGEVLIDSTSMKPLLHVDYGGAESAGDTTDFKSRVNVNGLINLQV